MDYGQALDYLYSGSKQYDYFYKIVDKDENGNEIEADDIIAPGANYDNLNWRDEDTKPTEVELIQAYNDSVVYNASKQYKTDRVEGEAPVYPMATDAADEFQNLIGALAEANITGLTIPQSCLDYRDACQAVKVAHPKP